MFALNTVNMPANAITKDELNSLSYMQVKGTGLANRCPEVVGEQSINIAAGKKYKITELCLEPTTFQVWVLCDSILRCQRAHSLYNYHSRLRRKSVLRRVNL